MSLLSAKRVNYIMSESFGSVLVGSRMVADQHLHLLLHSSHALLPQSVCHSLDHVFSVLQQSFAHAVHSPRSSYAGFDTRHLRRGMYLACSFLDVSRLASQFSECLFDWKLYCCLWLWSSTCVSWGFCCLTVNNDSLLLRNVRDCSAKK